MSLSLLIGTGFEIKRAVFLAEASQIAYDTNPLSVVSWAKAQGFQTPVPFDRKNVQGFWGVQGDVALLAFRGTSNPGQWIRDARFAPVPFPWGWIHAGFKDGVEDVGPDLADFYKALADAKPKYVWITGHSLGGALAVVAAARLKMQTSRIAGLYTYGQPRVGLGAFAERFSIELPGQLYRFVNQSDIVTRVPPGLLYRHTGIVKRIVRPGVLEFAAKLPNYTTGFGAPQFQPGFESSFREEPLATGATARVFESTALETAQAVASSGLEQTTMIDCDLPPLSDHEFRQLQMELTVQQDSPTFGGPGFEGSISWFSDHAIGEYIRLLKEIRDQ
ncbi:lipase (class 3) [Roseimicrobium gellanilyticum]|uniref:Lipase (Class 3) n=1 Tax=Roseimicrobium gellanilyticum TaxID=748857 RepID=A0A366HCH0_9BACT|nr:lipase family protein [Roseimicrobium gellanilyticum]RBP39670.1 lipase (class 3) [Roseimicrobium gellanilyticum]